MSTPQHSYSQPNIPVIKVGGKTDAVNLSGAVAGILREHGQADLHAIGAGPVNQAIKGVAIARGYFIVQGKDITMTPAFKDLEMDDGTTKTAMQIRIKLVEV